MNRVACAALLSTFLALSAAGQSVNWSQGIVYEYDGSGNVKKIGTDTYVYDTGQRLIRGSVAGSQQSYTYDSFGNRTGCQSGAGADCQYGLTINSSTNRISGRDYDNRGNLEQLPENNTLDYDELGMVRKETGNQRQAYFIYTADDERIAVYDADTQFNSHTWRWTVRGLDKKPLRELTSETSSGTVNFKWTKDQIWRDSVLLASRQLDATASGGVSTYHYHVDHLGTPRQVTSSAAILIGRHDYLPFGPEVSGNQNEPQPQTLKFTGHERDFVRDHPPLDYMHARYYEGRAGRFLSVDPGRDWDVHQPQSWNMYSYVRNNPVSNTDPDGRWCIPCLVPVAVAAVRAAPAVVRGGQRAYIYLSNPANVQRMINTGQSIVAVGVTMSEGIYEFPDAKEDGKTYVGQSEDTDRRLSEHESSGKKDPNREAKVKEVKGGKTAREHAEQNRVNELGGKSSTPGSQTSNKVNPIGPKRQSAVEKVYGPIKPPQPKVVPEL